MTPPPPGGGLFGALGTLQDFICDFLPTVPDGGGGDGQGGARVPHHSTKIRELINDHSEMITALC